MHSPYLVTTHRYFCPSCRREVEDEEMVTNEDELQVSPMRRCPADVLAHAGSSAGTRSNDDPWRGNSPYKDNLNNYIK